MKEQFLELVRGFAKIDVRTAPNYVTRLGMRDALINKGVDYNLANAIATQMEVGVNQDFVDDKEFFNEVIDNYSTALKNIMDVFAEDFHEVKIDSILNGITLKWN